MTIRMQLRPSKPSGRLSLSRCILLAFHVIAVVLLAAPAQGQAPAARAPADRADELHAEGLKLMAEGHSEQARARLLEAFQLKPSFDISGNLGAIELEMKRYRDAAEHLAHSLRHYPTAGSDAARKDTRQRLERASAEVATVRVTVNVAGARAAIDATPIGESPFPDALYVEAGEHRFTATHPRYQSAEVVRVVAKGKTADVMLELVPVAAPVPMPKNGDTATSPLLGTGIAFTALGMAGLAVGIAGEVLRAGASSDHDQTRARLPDSSTCSAPTATAPACADLQAAVDDHNTFRGMEITGFVLGGAALAGGIVMLAVALADGSESTATSVTLAPIVGPQAWGMTIAADW